MEAVMSVIRTIRSIRAELALPPTQTVPVLIRTDDSRGAWFRRSEPHILVLARASRVAVEGKTAGRPARSVGALLPEAEVFIELSAVAESAKERDRLQKTLSEVEADLGRLTRRLGDAEFTARAPADVVEKERERAADLRTRRSRLQEMLAALDPR
ncbi:MAG: hypothetical protein ACRDF6_09670, partial [bacterium]